MAVASAPALAASGGAAVPSTVSGSDGASGPATGGAAAGDPRAVQAKLDRQRAARERAERRRARRKAARKRARKRAAERRRREAAARDADKYVFPVRGAHSFGGDLSRFGAPRSGHRHQGQDVSASEGTPLVAPHAGRVRFIDYQASGAGLYVVIDDAGSRKEFVFMHLKRGSVTVSEGQAVKGGQRIGRVGSTGASSGPHLHFEIWVGPWQTGGHPIDPLPLLRRWDR